MPSGLPVVLRPNPWKWVGVGAVCFSLSVGGAWMVREGQWIGWLVMIGFGVGVPISLISAMPNASYLRLDSEGFTVCSIYRAYKIRWADVSGFGVGRVARRNKMVMYNFEPTCTLISPRVRSFMTKHAGYEGGLPDNYGLEHEELADLMNRYREASLAA